MILAGYLVDDLLTVKGGSYGRIVEQEELTSLTLIFNEQSLHLLPFIQQFLVPVLFVMYHSNPPQRDNAAVLIRP